MCEAKFVEQSLGFEISQPDRRGLPIPHGPVLGNLDHRIAAGDAEIDERNGLLALGVETVVTEPPEIKNIGERWQHLVPEETCTEMDAPQGR